MRESSFGQISITSTSLGVVIVIRIPFTLNNFVTVIIPQGDDSDGTIYCERYHKD